MRISDWSSDLCSSDLPLARRRLGHRLPVARFGDMLAQRAPRGIVEQARALCGAGDADRLGIALCPALRQRSEEHTSELQSLMRISYAVFCLKKKKNDQSSTTRTA